MIAVASGHPGVQAYVAERFAQEEVMLLDAWPQVAEQLAHMDAVFIGQRLADLPAPEVVASQSGPDMVIWVSEDAEARWRAALERGPRANLPSLWVGAMAPARLLQWLEPAAEAKVAAWTPPRRWAVYGLGAEAPRVPCISDLVQQSLRRYGPGLLADLAWHDPALTQSGLGASPGTVPWAYEELLPIRARFGEFVPAPPPWLAAVPWPRAEAVAALRERNRAVWQGFDLGSSLRNPVAAIVVSWVDEAVVVCPPGNWQSTLDATVEALRLMRGDLDIAVAVGSTPPRWVGAAAQQWDLRIYAWNRAGSARAQESSGPAGKAVKPANAVQAKEEAKWPTFMKIGIPTTWRRSRGRKTPNP